MYFSRLTSFYSDPILVHHTICSFYWCCWLIILLFMYIFLGGLASWARYLSEPFQSCFSHKYPCEPHLSHVIWFATFEMNKNGQQFHGLTWGKLWQTLDDNVENCESRTEKSPAQVFFAQFLFNSTKVDRPKEGRVLSSHPAMSMSTHLHLPHLNPC